MDENEELKKLLEEASRLVESLPEPFKVAAFEIVVPYMLDRQGSVGNYKRSAVQQLAQKKQDFFAKMSQEVGLEETFLKAVYKLVDGGSIRVVAVLEGSSAEKQRLLALLYFLANKIGLDKEWTSALEFAKQVDGYGINDGHISKSLKREEGILQTGRKRGKEYALSPNGVAKAKEVLKNLLEGRDG